MLNYLSMEVLLFFLKKKNSWTLRTNVTFASVAFYFSLGLGYFWKTSSCQKILEHFSLIWDTCVFTLQCLQRTTQCEWTCFGTFNTNFSICLFFPGFMSESCIIPLRRNETSFWTETQVPFLVVRKDSLHHGYQTEIWELVYLFPMFLLNADMHSAVTGLFVWNISLLENSEPFLVWREWWVKKMVKFGSGYIPSF